VGAGRHPRPWRGGRAGEASRSRRDRDLTGRRWHCGTPSSGRAGPAGRSSLVPPWARPGGPLFAALPARNPHYCQLRAGQRAGAASRRGRCGPGQRPWAAARQRPWAASGQRHATARGRAVAARPGASQPLRAGGHRATQGTRAGVTQVVPGRAADVGKQWPKPIIRRFARSQESIALASIVTGPRSPPLPVRDGRGPAAATLPARDEMSASWLMSVWGEWFHWRKGCQPGAVSGT